MATVHTGDALRVLLTLDTATIQPALEESR